MKPVIFKALKNIFFFLSKIPSAMKNKKIPLNKTMIGLMKLC